MARGIRLLLAAASIVVAAQLGRLRSLSRREQATSSGGMDVDFDVPRGSVDNRFARTNATTSNDGWRPLPWSLPTIDPHSLPTSGAFMEELGRWKRSINLSLPWDTPGTRNHSISLPTPIVSLNLPKSATLTLYEYFKCGGYGSAHTYVPGHVPSLRIGDCVRDNFLSDAPPFRGCDVDNTTHAPVDFYSDVGIPEPRCFYSSLHDGGLDHIAKYHPNATIVMMPRPFEDWYKSVLKWGRGRLLGRWRKVCGFRGATRGGCAHGDAECWKDFYHSHTEKIRRFVKEHPRLTYVEVPLDDEAPSVLEGYTGIPSSCLQHCVPGKPKDPTINLRTYKKCKPIADKKDR